MGELDAAAARGFGGVVNITAQQPLRVGHVETRAPVRPHRGLQQVAPPAVEVHQPGAHHRESGGQPGGERREREELRKPLLRGVGRGVEYFLSDGGRDVGFLHKGG